MRALLARFATVPRATTSTPTPTRGCWPRRSGSTTSCRRPSTPGPTSTYRGEEWNDHYHSPAGDRLRARLTPAAVREAFKRLRAAVLGATGTSRGGLRTPSSTGSSWPPIASPGRATTRRRGGRDAGLHARPGPGGGPDDARAHPHLARPRDGPRLAHRAPAGGGGRARPRARGPRPPGGRRVPAGPQTRRRRPHAGAPAPADDAAARLRELVLDHDGRAPAASSTPRRASPAAAARAPTKKLPGLVDVAALPPIARRRRPPRRRGRRRRSCGCSRPTSPRPPGLERDRRRSPGACSRPGWPRARRPRTSGRCSRSARSAATRTRDQARADDPRLAGGEPARARGARPRRARRRSAPTPR